MGQYRDRMYEYMVLRNYSERTIQSYLAHMTALVRYYRKSPELLSEADGRRYLFHMREKQSWSWSNLNQAICAFNLFYTKVLERTWDVGKIPRPMTERRLPVDLSRDEIKRLLEAVINLKHRAILLTTYGGGLRLSEALHLKLSDIDSDRMQILVRAGKGRKDRYTLLSKTALSALRTYWQVYHPTYFLFPGRDGQQPLDANSFQRVFHQAKKKPASQNPLRFTVSGTVSRPICLKMA